MKTFFVILIIIIAYLSGYHAGRYTTGEWIECSNYQPLSSGYYLVTVDNEKYAKLWYWDMYEGLWYGDTDGKVIAWRYRIKGWG